MKLNRTSAVMEYKFVSSFESLRNKLLSQEKYADRLEKPLAYWALPNDRRLPLAFMDRSVRQLLNTPFEELYATPGVGQKKIHSLLNLLARAAKAPSPKDDPVTTLLKNGDIFEEDGGVKKDGKIDPTTVSEAAWRTSDDDDETSRPGNEPIADETPESVLAAKEIGAVVNAAMEALPSDLREAVILREIEGLTYEEIAAAMNCPIGTVRSRIFRAREAVSARIRPLLEKQGGKRW